MTIREYAKKHDFKVVGKLTRHPEFEWDEDPLGVYDPIWSGFKFYVDEAGNEYYIKGNLIDIVPREED